MLVSSFLGQSEVFGMPWCWIHIRNGKFYHKTHTFINLNRFFIVAPLRFQKYFTENLLPLVLCQFSLQLFFLDPMVYKLCYCNYFSLNKWSRLKWQGNIKTDYKNFHVSNAKLLLVLEFSRLTTVTVQWVYSSRCWFDQTN